VLATLNYKSATGEVYFSIESGSWFVDVTATNVLGVRNELGVTSSFVSMSDGDYLTIHVAKTDVSNTYYYAQYHFSSGTLTAVTEHNITATITALS